MNKNQVFWLLAAVLGTSKFNVLFDYINSLIKVLIYSCGESNRSSGRRERRNCC